MRIISTTQAVMIFCLSHLLLTRKTLNTKRRSERAKTDKLGVKNDTQLVNENMKSHFCLLLFVSRSSSCWIKFERRCFHYFNERCHGVVLLLFFFVIHEDAVVHSIYACTRWRVIQIHFYPQIMYFSLFQTPWCIENCIIFLFAKTARW